MARTEAQRARARAQRATAKAVREQRRQLPKQTTQKARETRTQYLQRMLEHPEEQPAKGTPESKSLAREASNAYYGKTDASYQAFDDHFYHKPQLNEDEEEDFYEDYDEEEEAS